MLGSKGGCAEGLGLLVTCLVRFGVARFGLFMMARIDADCSCSRVKVGVVW